MTRHFDYKQILQDMKTGNNNKSLGKNNKNSQISKNLQLYFLKLMSSKERVGKQYRTKIDKWRALWEQCTPRALQTQKSKYSLNILKLQN